MAQRVLNLICPPGPTGMTPLLRLTADLAREEEAASGCRHAWLLVGGEAVRDAAIAAGIDHAVVRLMPKPAGLRAWLPGALGAYGRLFDQATRVDCWTDAATRLASTAGCAHAVPRFSQATLSPVSRGMIGPAGQALRDKAEPSRLAARQHWAVPDSAFVVGVLADRPEAVDVREALLAMAFTRETLETADSPRQDIRMVCHPGCAGRMHAGDLARLLEQPQMLVQDAAMLRPWDTLAGCDLVLAPTPMQAGLSLAWAEAIGVPVIVPPAPHLVGLDSLKGLHAADSYAAKDLARAMTDFALSQSDAPLTLAS